MLGFVITAIWAIVPAQVPHSVALEAADAVQADNIVRAITALQSTPGRTRVTGTSGAEAGREVVRSTLAKAGLHVERQPFVVRNPFNRRRRVVGVNLWLKLGPAHGRALVLIAHLDSKAAEDAKSARKARWRWNRDAAPGADDNASGSAALLEIARVLSERQAALRRPLYLVWTDAEELATVAKDGFMDNYGAQVFAQSLADQERSVASALAVDMLARSRPYGHLLRLYSDGGPDSAGLAQVLSLAAAVVSPSVIIDARVVPSFTWSDHAAFWALGQGGLLLIEDDFHHERYHQMTDFYSPSESFYSMAQVQAATRLLVATVLLF